MKFFQKIIYRQGLADLWLQYAEFWHHVKCKMPKNFNILTGASSQSKQSELVVRASCQEDISIYRAAIAAKK